MSSDGMIPPRLCWEFLHVTRLKHRKCDNLRKEECQVIWSVDDKENSQGLFNIPVWSVYTSKKTKKEKLSMIENRQNVTTVFVSSAPVT